MHIKRNVSSLSINRLKGTLLISKLHKSLSGVSHLGKTYLTYVPKTVPFSLKICRCQLVERKKLPNLEYHCSHLSKSVGGKVFVLKFLWELVFCF